MSQPFQTISCLTETIKDGKNNRITEAVVFTDQAFVKRQVKTRAQKGLNRFHIEVQADAVDVDSVQAGVAGDGEILSVQYRKVPMEDAPDKDISKLENKKERLTRKRLQLRKEKTVAKKQIHFLDSIVGFAETDMPLKIKSEFPTR